MNRFMAWWLRKVVKNELRPALLYILFFRKNVDKHYEKQLYMRRSEETGLYYLVKERAYDE